MSTTHTHTTARNQRPRSSAQYSNTVTYQFHDHFSGPGRAIRPIYISVSGW